MLNTQMFIRPLNPQFSRKKPYCFNPKLTWVFCFNLQLTYLGTYLQITKLDFSSPTEFVSRPLIDSLGLVSWNSICSGNDMTSFGEILKDRKIILSTTSCNNKKVYLDLFFSLSRQQNFKCLHCPREIPSKVYWIIFMDSIISSIQTT